MSRQERDSRFRSTRRTIKSRLSGPIAVAAGLALVSCGGGAGKDAGRNDGQQAVTTVIPVSSTVAEAPVTTTVLSPREASTTTTTEPPPTEVDCTTYQYAQRIILDARKSRSMRIFGDSSHGATVAVAPDGRRAYGFDFYTPQAFSGSTNGANDRNVGSLFVSQGAPEVDIFTRGEPGEVVVDCSSIPGLQGLATDFVNGVIDVAGHRVDARTATRSGREDPDRDKNRIYQR